MGNGTAFQGAINHLVVIKRNTIENNGGIEVRGHTTNVLVEGNAVRNSSVGAPARTALVCARRPLTDPRLVPGARRARQHDPGVARPPPQQRGAAQLRFRWPMRPPPAASE